MNQPTPPKFHPGQYVQATDGTTGFIQAVTRAFGRVLYVLDPETCLEEGEIRGLCTDND